MDPDEGVVAAVQLLFQQFRILGTAFKVMKYFAQHQIPFLGEFGDLATSESYYSVNRLLSIEFTKLERLHLPSTRWLRSTLWL